MLGDSQSLNCFFLVSFVLCRASWIQRRSPSLGVSRREAWCHQVWVATLLLLFLRLRALSLPPSPFSLPSQLLSPSLYPCLPPSFISFRPSVATSLPSSHSFPLSFSFLCLPPSICPLIPGTFSLCLFVPCPPFPTLSPLRHSTKSPMISHSLTVFLNGVILVFFCLENCPYFPFFRDMMRKMLKQMRPEPEWRAARQDGCNNIEIYVSLKLSGAPGLGCSKRD